MISSDVLEGSQPFLLVIRSIHHPQQAESMLNRSTTVHIFVLCLIVERAKKEFCMDRPLCTSFIKLKSVFNTINHSSLWKIPKLIGVPPEISAQFQQLYSSAKKCMQVNGKASDWFAISLAAQQQRAAKMASIHFTINSSRLCPYKATAQWLKHVKDIPCIRF